MDYDLLTTLQLEIDGVDTKWPYQTKLRATCELFVPTRLPSVGHHNLRDT